MRRHTWIAIALLALVSIARGAEADAPTVMIVRNDGTASTRVQVALGPAMPCDSSDNRMMFDGVLLPGTTRVVPLDQAVIACARHTSKGSTLDWQPSRWIRGGLRCGRGRGAPCWPDPSVPMVFDATP